MSRLAVRQEIAKFKGRYRWRTALQWFTALGLFGTLLLIGIYWGNAHSAGSYVTAVNVVRAIVLAIAVGMVIQVVRLLPNDLAVARRIEFAFPDLKQRLLTAAEFPYARRLSYLQQSLIAELSKHAEQHRWSRLISNQQLFTWSMLAVVSMGVWVIVANAVSQLPARSLAATDQPDGDTTVTLMSQQGDLVVQVEPGNTEIEKGTPLLVFAKFPQRSPAACSLVVEDDGLPTDEVSSGSNETTDNADTGTGRQVIPMNPSLEDPLFGARLPEVIRPFTYKVVFDQGESETFRVTVFEFPTLVQPNAHLQFPEYTNLSPRTVEDTYRISAVEGTRLTWRLHLNKPIADGYFLDEADNPLALQSTEDPHAYEVAMTLVESQKWTLHLTDHDGRQNKQPPQFSVRVIPNQPAEVKLLAARDVRVSPLEEFLVQANLEDDFGLVDYGVTYSIGEQGSTDLSLMQFSGTKQQTLEHLFELERLQAEPDQLLSYHFWADDTDAQGNVRRSYSDMFFAEVRPFEEIFREGQQPPSGQSSQQQQQQQGQGQNAQQAEQLAELQKQIINAIWTLIRRETKAEVSSSFVTDADLIRESQLTAQQQLGELAGNVQDAQSAEFVSLVQEKMTQVVDQLTTAVSDQSVSPLSKALAAAQASYQGLLRLRAREHEVVQQQQQQQSSSSSSSSSPSSNRFQQQLQQLQLQNDQNRYETERQAEQQEDQAAQDVRQVMNRLRELARRQEDINKQLQELQLSLEQAETEAEREELERQLKRLREQQEQLLRDTDELLDRIDESAAPEQLEETRQQVEQSRENVQQASESLQNNQTSQALSAGTRAEREFENARDDLQQQSANQFEEQMRDMRQQARELQENQERLAEAMRGNAETETPSLRDEQPKEDVQESLQQQEQALQELMQQMQQTVMDAEETQPLLAQDLYDTYRQVEQDRVAQNLRQADTMLERGLRPQAEVLEQEAREGINNLRQQVDRAAERVLGDDAEFLERASAELNDLANELQQEIERNSPSNPSEPNDANGNDSSNPSPNQANDPNSPNSNQQQNGQQQNGQQQDGQQQNGQQQDGQQQNGQQQDGQQSGQGGGQSSVSRDGQQQGESQRPAEDSNRPSSQNPGGQRNNGGGGVRTGGLEEFAGGINDSPLTGGNFREWSDRLRDVEELIDDPELRAEAARIRDRARGIRAEFTRHSKEPQWPLVQELVANPLRELQRRVAEELIRKTGEKNATVPIDRDPVPERFSEQVKRYYEALGAGQ